MSKSLLLLFVVYILTTLSLLADGTDRAIQSGVKRKVFIENKGQFDGRNWQSDKKIKYAIDYDGFKMFFNQSGFTYRMDKFLRNTEDFEFESLVDRKQSKKPRWITISELVDASWVGSNPNVETFVNEVTDHYFSYAIKNPTTGKISNVNHINGYKQLVYKNLYQNVDVDYFINPEKGIKYNITLRPGADLSKVRIKYNDFHSKTKSEYTRYSIEPSGDFKIQTSLGDIAELKPIAYYSDTKERLNIKFRFENNELFFEAENYDNSREMVIDPWIINATFNSSTAVWEVETDGPGNVYVIGGETPMKLEKYNNAGSLQWTYSTPWDTSNVWLGTLATDNSGTCYITSGTSPSIERINNLGGMDWHTDGSATSDEWWSISFNCDKTKLVIGGTKLNMLAFSAYATIFNMNTTDGSVISTQDLDYTNIAGFGANPIEVRSIASSLNAKYIFLTHKDVGVINQNIGLCPSNLPAFQVPNNYELSYKCENYLPATQNGGGLKALCGNSLYIYTHSGDSIHRRSQVEGALINSVPLPGGSSQILLGKKIIKNSGMAIDNCGNVYAGSGDRVVKFDPDLNILLETNTGFTIYDIAININGEIVAVGAQSNSDVTNRNGKIQSINMSACPQTSVGCCDANICNVDTVCSTDAPFDFIASNVGGIWSGSGITNASTGTFNPAVAGPGNHQIFYTMPCGADSVIIRVNSCAALSVCEQPNGDITVLNGTPTYIWEQYNPATTTPITNEAECTACGGTWTPFVNLCMVNSMPVTECNAPASWTTFATGSTVTPSGVWPIRVTDGSFNTIQVDNMTSVISCSDCSMLTVTLNQTPDNGTCNGSANASVAGGTPPYNYLWSTSATTSSISGLCAGVYSLTVTDANNCSVVSTVDLTVVGSKTVFENSIEVFPNPTSNKIYIKNAGNAKVVIYNMTGEIIKKMENPGNLKSIDMSSFDNGSYLVRIIKQGKEYSTNIILRK
ncbi:MAG TPA: hypothetical protein DEH02_20540 [Bacteroidales bacterium]|nr:MAG: hypothetical protein A2X01_16410 [Bacteroidetes bacterium GWF2_35_48]OFY94068.1 MAG: hypothetical protein A2491_17130 [Bacteroidetes bacterium RIFOXYC12_FULL_35_7]HBX53455.1 hypothetical protein [Bacteroidales bacterium]